MYKGKKVNDSALKSFTDIFSDQTLTDYHNQKEIISRILELFDLCIRLIELLSANN